MLRSIIDNDKAGFDVFEARFILNVFEQCATFSYSNLVL